MGGEQYVDDYITQKLKVLYNAASAYKSIGKKINENKNGGEFDAGEITYINYDKDEKTCDDILTEMMEIFKKFVHINISETTKNAWKHTITNGSELYKIKEVTIFCRLFELLEHGKFIKNMREHVNTLESDTIDKIIYNAIDDIIDVHKINEKFVGISKINGSQIYYDTHEKKKDFTDSFPFFVYIHYNKEEKKMYIQINNKFIHYNDSNLIIIEDSHKLCPKNTLCLMVKPKSIKNNIIHNNIQEKIINYYNSVFLKNTEKLDNYKFLNLIIDGDFTEFKDDHESDSHKFDELYEKIINNEYENEQNYGLKNPNFVAIKFDKLYKKIMNDEYDEHENEQNYVLNNLFYILGYHYCEIINETANINNELIEKIKSKWADNYNFVMDDVFKINENMDKMHKIKEQIIMENEWINTLEKMKPHLEKLSIVKDNIMESGNAIITLNNMDDIIHCYENNDIMNTIKIISTWTGELYKIESDIPGCSIVNKEDIVNKEHMDALVKMLKNDNRIFENNNRKQKYISTRDAIIKIITQDNVLHSIYEYIKELKLLTYRDPVNNRIKRIKKYKESIADVIGTKSDNIRFMYNIEMRMLLGVRYKWSLIKLHIVHNLENIDTEIHGYSFDHTQFKNIMTKKNTIVINRETPQLFVQINRLYINITNKVITTCLPYKHNMATFNIGYVTYESMKNVIDIINDYYVNIVNDIKNDKIQLR